MTGKKITALKNLEQIRQENMSKWTEADHKFYSDFLKDIPVKKKKPLREEKEEVIKEE